MGRRFKWHMFFTSFLPLWVSMVLFDNESVVIHDRLPLGRVPRMTEKEYFTRGCTALLDAVGGAIHHIGNIHMLIVGYTDMMLTHERAYAPNGSRMASVLCQKLSEKKCSRFLLIVQHQFLGIASSGSLFLAGPKGHKHNKEHFRSADC